MPRFIRFSRLVHDGNRWKRIRFDWHQRSIRNLRIAAFRRRSVGAHPGVHIGDHRAPEVADREWRLWLLTKQISLTLRRRKRPRKMLKACEMVNSDVW